MRQMSRMRQMSNCLRKSTEILLRQQSNLSPANDCENRNECNYVKIKSHNYRKLVTETVTKLNIVIA
jgi:hypothetical protein